MNKFLIIPLTLAVAACGGNDEVASGTFDDGEGGKGSYSVRGDGDDSETVIKTGDGEVRIGTGAKATENLPMDLALYPGAEIQSSITGSGEGKSGAMIVFHSDDSQEKVVAFYKDQMKSKGIEVKAEVKAGDMQMISGARKDGEGVNVTVTKDDDGGVNASLIVGGKS